ncbi:MAG: head-tail connector protein [Stygiobacter sp.]
MITLEEYKRYLKIQNITYDEELQNIINAVETKVEQFLNRNLLAQDYVEYYDGSGSELLILRNIPVNSVSKIEYYEGRINNVDIWTEWTQDNQYSRLLIPKEKHGIILEGGIFIKGIQNFRITYNAGYTTLPYDINLACKELVKIALDNSPLGKSYLGVTAISDNTGGSSQNITFEDDRENKVLQKIEHYKVLNV